MIFVGMSTCLLFLNVVNKLLFSPSAFPRRIVMHELTTVSVCYMKHKTQRWPFGFLKPPASRTLPLQAFEA